MYRLGLNATYAKPVPFSVVVDEGIATIEVQGGRGVTIGSRRPVEAVATSLAERRIVVVAGVNTKKRTSNKFSSSVVNAN